MFCFYFCLFFSADGHDFSLFEAIFILSNDSNSLMLLSWYSDGIMRQDRRRLAG